MMMGGAYADRGGTIFGWLSHGSKRQTREWINKNQFYFTYAGIMNVIGWELALSGVDFSRKYA